MKPLSKLRRNAKHGPLRREGSVLGASAFNPAAHHGMLSTPKEITPMHWNSAAVGMGCRRCAKGGGMANVTIIERLG
jgi:hypothetical protein